MEDLLKSLDIQSNLYTISDVFYLESVTQYIKSSLYSTIKNQFLNCYTVQT